MWFANSRSHPRLGYESVAFKAGKVGTHSVVSQVESVSKFVYGPLARAQELKDFSTGTFEQAVAPAYILH